MTSVGYVFSSSGTHPPHYRVPLLDRALTDALAGVVAGPLITSWELNSFLSLSPTAGSQLAPYKGER